MAAFTAVPNETQIINDLVSLEKNLDRQIEALEEKKQTVQDTIRTFSDGSRKGFSLHTSLRKRGTKKTKAPKKGYGKQMSLLRRGPRPVAKRGRRGKMSALPGMEMARQVIDNHGSEMDAESVKQAIRKDFGVEPPPSLTQMLYKRSRAKSSFYRNSDGKYGLLSWNEKAKAA